MALKKKTRKIDRIVVVCRLYEEFYTAMHIMNLPQPKYNPFDYCESVVIDVRTGEFYDIVKAIGLNTRLVPYNDFIKNPMYYANLLWYDVPERLWK